MKTFFTRNRKLVEIFLTLLLVFLAAGYYYLIYIPARENEIIERRFRTLQRIEKNMQEKMQGYLSTIKNCVARGDEIFFQDIVNAYNKEPEKFRIKVLKKDAIGKDKFIKLNHDSLMGALVDSLYDSTGFNAMSNGRKMMITYNWSKLKRDSTITNVTVEGLINYKEFIAPLLRKNVFDHYLVFNVSDRGINNINSNVVYEDFPSGISFNDVDSLFDAKEKVYTSRIIKIETGGEKYLAFLHPCGYNRKNERIVAGLLKEETFNKEKQQLPEKMVTTILFIALFTFLLLPVIRLTLLGKKERIRLFDVFAVYCSFLLLVPVLILVVFWNRARFIPNKSPKAESKQVLANQISQSLLSEVDSAYALLHTMDLIHQKDDSLKIIDTFNIRYLANKEGKKAMVHDLKDTSNNNKTAHVAAVKRLDSLLSGKPLYHNTEFVFWVDVHSGREIANWAFDDDPPRGNYKSREYFINARDAHKLIFLDDSGLRHFVIQPLVSRTDGKFKFVIARRSFTDSLIVASASRFSSVINPVLPMGFGFCVTDASGNIIFDSDTTHNLNENLLEEFTDPAAFKAALDTKTSREFKTRYEDEEQSVLVQPVPGLPSYFIVISENGSFESSLNTQCFSFTMVMMFSFFLFLCIEMITVLVCHSRETKLLKNKMDLSWMHPRASMSGKYFFLSVFNTGMLILLGLFCFIGFSMQRIIEYIFLFAMAALLSTIAAGVYKLGETGSEKIERAAEKRNKNAIKALTILAILVLLSSLQYSFRTSINVMLFSAISILLFIMLGRIKEPLNNTGYLVNFRRMVFSKLLLTSGIPVVIFFMCIYNFERRLEERLKLLDYAENISNRVKNGKELKSVIAQIKAEDGLRSFYIDSLWIADVEHTSPGADTVTRYTYADNISFSLLKTSRVHYNDVSGTTENFELIKPFGSNQFFFNSIFSNTGNVLTYNTTDMSGGHAVTNTIKLSSSAAKVWRAPCSFPGGLIFLLLLFGALVLCYQLLKYAINKIFGSNTPATENAKVVYEKLLTDESVPYVFVQGVPGGGTTAFIKKHLKLARKSNHNKKYNTIIFNFNGMPGEVELAIEKEHYEKQMAESDQLKENDFLEMPGNYKVMALPKVLAKPKQQNWYARIEALADDHVECIVFTHLEYNMLNGDANRMKLKLIEKFVHEGRKKIIISSGISHVEFINSTKKIIYAPSPNTDHKTESKKESKDPGNEQETNGACLEYINRWNNLLGKFTNVYINSNEINESANKQPPVSTPFSVAELGRPVFLNKYKEQFKASADESKTEDNILMVQSLSEQPYRQVWASLTHEEQLIVYDLAEDGLVNTANFMPLSRLLNKGLILKKDGILMIMNRSFRNFVLTTVNTGEVKNIEKEINEGQTWNDYKYPVLIILGGLVYFVLSSNPEKFGNVLPLVSGLMAGIPTVLKLLSYMKPSENKG